MATVMEQVEHTEKKALRQSPREVARLEQHALQQEVVDPEVSNLATSELRPQTLAVLQAEDRQLLDADAIMADNTGVLAERYAQVVIKSEGLPVGRGRVLMSEVTSLKLGDTNRGVDLIGVEQRVSRETGQVEGVPNLIEVKKRLGTDAMGRDAIQFENMEPETKQLMADIKAERAMDPIREQRAEALRAQAQQEMPNNPEMWDSYDEEMSTAQMGGMWARDRWLKTIKDPEVAAQLRQAGVSERYLDLDKLRDPYSPEWRDILDRRRVIMVTYGKEGASTSLLRDAVFRRHADVLGLRLGV